MGAAADARGGAEDEFLGDFAHRIDEFIELPVIGDRLFHQLCLRGRQRHADGLGSDFSSPAPRPGWSVHHASLADPTHAG